MRVAAGSWVWLALALAACGGGGGSSPPTPPPPTVAAPVITTAPAPQSVVAGQAVSFEVAASGAALQYQWRRNEVDIIDAVAARYTLAAAQAGDHGHAFSVTVRNAAGAVTSTAARLSVLAITAPPQPAEATAGEPASFSVATTGDGVSLQWQRNGVDVPGATQLALKLPVTALADDQSQWTVTARNAAGALVSPVVALSVQPKPPGSLELVAGDAGGRGNLDGPGSSARFSFISGLARDAAGMLWVVDNEGRVLRQVRPDGQVSTVVGAPVAPQLLDGPAAVARFVYISQIVWSAGPPVAALYVIDDGRLRRIDADGRVTTLTSAEAGYVDGPLASARFRRLGALAAHPDGSLYVSERLDCAVRRIHLQTGQVSTLARTPVCNPDWNAPPALWDITSMAVDGQGRVNALRSGVVLRINAAGLVSSPAAFDYPSPYTFIGRSLAVDAAGRVHFFVPDTNWTVGSYFHLLEDGSVAPSFATIAANSLMNPFVVTPAGRFVHTDNGQLSLLMAGGGQATSVLAGAAVNPLRVAPKPLAVEGDGSLLRFVKPQGSFGAVHRQTRAGTEQVIALQQAFNGYPSEMVSDGQGGVYTLTTESGFCIMDYCTPEPGRIDHITAGGQLQFIAGSALAGEDNGTGVAAQFLSPRGLTLGPGGDLFVTTPGRIRRVTTAGVVSTFASGLPAAEVLAADGAGNLYLASRSGPLIRKFTPQGQVSFFHAPATASADETLRLGIFGLAVAANGDLLAARCRAGVVDRITAAGTVSTVVGQAGLSGIRTGELPGALDCPSDLSWDARGGLYIRTESAFLKARFSP